MLKSPRMKLQTAALAGGCFWCTEAIFKRLKGVVSVIPGYSGGTKDNPTYKEVCEGTTGHAESIQIEFDQKIIPYQKLLEVFFALHDPTTANRQGNDIGTQYRSAIFYHSAKQKETAQKVKEKIEKSKMYKDPIVTEISPFTKFYKAENYHQNYYDSNRSQQYCQLVIDPKITKLYKFFSKSLRESERGTQRN